MMNIFMYVLVYIMERVFSFVLKSMTGFGSSEYYNETYKLHVEIKSVNYRYNDIMIHLPKALNPLEDRIKKLITASLTRGKIDIFISFEQAMGHNKQIKVDKDLAIAYYNALSEISSLLKIPNPDNVYEIANYQDVLRLDEDSFDLDLVQSSILETVQKALEQLVSMRKIEGQHLLDDLTMRLNDLEANVSKIEEQVPMILTCYREKLLKKLQDVLSETQIDESRLIQECALFSEKINFTEELVRLKSHFKQFRATITDSTTAVGRKLDFIVQEMNRETNTIASKANDMETAKLVVEMKSEIEKIREQIQNVE